MCAIVRVIRSCFLPRCFLPLARNGRLLPVREPPPRVPPRNRPAAGHRSQAAARSRSCPPIRAAIPIPDATTPGRVEGTPAGRKRWRPSPSPLLPAADVVAFRRACAWCLQPRSKTNHPDDFPNGQGTYILADGSRYEGGIRNGRRDGQGTETAPNGARYRGDYRKRVPMATYRLDCA
jgi:hypothetical protein